VRVDGVERRLARDGEEIDVAVVVQGDAALQERVASVLGGEMVFRELGCKVAGVTKLDNLLRRRNW
jgi:hypothetical protein